MLLCEKLPPEIWTAIYHFDPTYSTLFNKTLLEDVVVYKKAPDSYHYLPDGIHARLFQPRYWAVETNVLIHANQDQNINVRILRFFLHKDEWNEYRQSLISTTIPTQRIHWKHLDAFMKDSFFSI